MARARNIKPGFFKNEDLAECSPWARLCFAGLWTLADREGRLEDRAKRIKGELFAYDSIEAEPLLVELEGRGFLVRYRNSDGAFIQISKFSTHQTPHYSEKPSVIKPPDFQESKPDEAGETPRGLREDSKKSAVMKRGAQPPDSLNPSSPNPDPVQDPPATRVPPWSPPAWIPGQQWQSFIAMRKAKGKRAPFTEAARDGIVATLEKLYATGHDIAAVLQESVNNGWSGVFAPKMIQQPNGMTFKERDSANAAERVKQAGGGLVHAKPIATRRNDALQEVFDATPRLVG